VLFSCKDYTRLLICQTDQNAVILKVTFCSTAFYFHKIIYHEGREIMKGLPMNHFFQLEEFKIYSKGVNI